MCRNIYLPDEEEDEDDAEDAGDEDDDALAYEAARRRALTTGGVRPPPAPTQSRNGSSRRRTIEAMPSPSPSFVSSTSAQRPTRSERSVGVATVTTAPTSGRVLKLYASTTKRASMPEDLAY
ncbi:hypothetical protein ON010_g18106 [Phytophthora cinnamomi]|nr:hypothetical protein ON010_g18106 [Phytophthora cinnamomi]